MMTAELAPTVELNVFVPGKPAAQGSKKYVGHRRSAKTGKMAPVLLEQSRAVKPWRELVAEVVALHWRGRPLLTCALGVRLQFVMPRPVGTPRSRTPLAIKRPDCDKLSRSIFDALTCVIWADDSLVVDLHATKRIAEVGERPGCRIIAWCVQPKACQR